MSLRDRRSPGSLPSLFFAILSLSCEFGGCGAVVPTTVVWRTGKWSTCGEIGAAPSGPEVNPEGYPHPHPRTPPFTSFLAPKGQRYIFLVVWRVQSQTRAAAACFNAGSEGTGAEYYGRNLSRFIPVCPVGPRIIAPNNSSWCHWPGMPSYGSCGSYGSYGSYNIQ